MRSLHEQFFLAVLLLFLLCVCETLLSRRTTVGIVSGVTQIIPVRSARTELRWSSQSMEAFKPGAVATRSYISKKLRFADRRGYKAAGMLVWRRGEGGSVEVLLGRQARRKPKIAKSAQNRVYGTWTFIGGKRDPGEADARVTAVREMSEESLEYLTASWAEKALKRTRNRSSPAVSEDRLRNSFRSRQIEKTTRIVQIKSVSYR